MKRAAFTWLWHSAVILGVLGAGGLFVAVSGVVPIRASSGHWALTQDLLQVSKERSVATHTAFAEKPRLHSPWLVLKGAGHFETGCRPCHGSPGAPQPVIASAMLPPAPNLAPLVGKWDAEELFYIVKHGIKFTGMPAWPALQRDDEVTAVVAFLLELPKLDAAGYRRLVHGEQPDRVLRAPLEDLDAPAPPIVTTSCARCHGERGEGRGSAAFPGLAGQSREYLANAMEAYARGRRHSGIMQPLAAPLRREEWGELAEYYANMPPVRAERAAFPASEIERGRRIAEDGIRGQGVPSCSDCHGPGGAKRKAAYPLLAGQYADYLVLQLELFKTHARGGSPYAHIMENVASRLRPEQMRDVARYYASLPPAPR